MIELLMAADPSAISVLMMALQVLMGLLVAIIGFVMKGVISDLRKVSDELKSFQISTLSERLATQTFETYRQETRVRLHDLGDRLAAVEGKLSLR